MPSTTPHATKHNRKHNQRNKRKVRAWLYGIAYLCAHTLSTVQARRDEQAARCWLLRSIGKAVAPHPRPAPDEHQAAQLRLPNWA